jgi:hypothetical protein
MNRLYEQVGTQLRTFGRCAMMGTLIGLMTTQAFAASAPTMTSEQAAAPETTSVTNNASTQAIATTPTANLQITVADDAKPADIALPEAPNAPEEQASVTKPIDIKAIMGDAAQNTQNLQPTTTTEKKHQAHPAWLVLTAVGVLAFAIGIVPLTDSTTRGKPIAGAFVGIGAGLSGLGLYLTFK